ncbi:MAG: hypothetical protein HY236_15120 [Acidobacteria bacterium]|nr:hypothetical protein [Acidobacteriota bacterium]
MTPATHAAVGAAIASRTRNLSLALALSFGSHFVLDSIYHFEAFYPLSVPEKWSYAGTMLTLLAALTALGIPVAAWSLRKDREAWLFAGYAFLMCALPFEWRPAWRLTWAILLAGTWWAISPSAAVRRWVLCGFVSYLPDVLKGLLTPVESLHEAMHYRSSLDLGDWISLLARGRWKLHVNYRIYDPWYQLGYALEILVEGAILFGSFYLLARRPSVADLAAVHHQADPVDKGSLVG